MNEPKPFASLGPTLLARKGGARPAMRPQVTPFAALAPQPLSLDEDVPGETYEEALEDLGWNDMGEDHDEDLGEAYEATVVPLTTRSSPLARREPLELSVEAPLEAPDEAWAEPEVRRQQKAIARSIAAAERRSTEATLAAGKRAAFTLRLDAERHLKLRLASTVMNRSAQQLVTQALDKYLAELPDIDALAAHVNRD